MEQLKVSAQRWMNGPLAREGRSVSQPIAMLSFIIVASPREPVKIKHIQSMRYDELKTFEAMHVENRS